jgi:small conductance mechanosensitive channel
MLGLDYSSDLSKAIQVIIESVSKTEGVLLGKKKPAVIIDEFAASTINLRVLFWLDTFKSSSKSYHLAIRTQVMKNVLLALTENEFSLPSNIVEVKQYEG